MKKKSSSADKQKAEKWDALIESRRRGGRAKVPKGFAAMSPDKIRAAQIKAAKQRSENRKKCVD